MMDGDSDSERSASLRHQDQTSLEDALVEARKWIENVTRKKFQSDDFRRSMTDGILLCMLMQKIRPGLIKKINQSRSIYAGVDNLNVFLGACEDLGLKAAQLFHPGDLQDLSSRASLSVHDRRKEEERRLKSVCITIFWLGRTANQLDTFTGPQLNLDAFAPLIHGSSSLVKGLSPDNASSGVSSWASGGSLNNNLRTSLGYNDDVFTSDGIDLTAIAPEKYSEPKWKRDLKKELDSSVPGLSEYADHANSRPILRMDTSRRRPPPVAAKPLHSRSKSMPERSTLERQNSVEDEDSQSYRSGSSGDPTSPTTYDEFVKSKGLVQEDQEMWMSSLDSWKSRRRRATHSALERKASREEVEQQELSKQRRRSKTYQEMMEEKEKREKILMKMASKNKSLDAEDIVHILTKPALYEEEIRDVPERRTRSKSIPGNFKQGESMPSMFDATNPTYSVDSTDAPSLSRQPPPDVFPKPKVRRSGVGSAFAPYQRTNSRESNKGSRTVLSSQRVDDFTNLRPGHVEPMTFREKLLRDREREIGLSAVQRDSKSSARLPQKKRLSLGIMGRVAAFNKGETEVETQPKLQPPRPAPKPEPEYMALTINMKQKPRNENGFGFTIFGGADSKRPIVVTSITPGSTADKNELRVGDEIIAINGETTKMVTYDHALYCFSSSVLDGELTLKVHRYEDLGKRVRSTSGTRSTEHTTAKSDTSEFAKRRAFSQPSDPKNLSQAARARKILQQMRDEEQRMEDLRWEREEERMGATVNGNQNWNHSDNKQGPLRAYYDEPEPEERPLGDAIPSGPAASSVSEPADSVPFKNWEDTQMSPNHTSFIEPEIKQDVVKPVEKPDPFSNLERNSPSREEYGESAQISIEVKGDEISPKRDTISPNTGIVSDNLTEDVDGKYPYDGVINLKPKVEGDRIEPVETVVKTEVAKEQSVNLLKLLGHDALETPQSGPLAKDGNRPEETGPDGGIIDDPPDRKTNKSKPHSHWINNLERLTMTVHEIESDGDMFSSEDDERMEEEIMNKMQEEQRAEEEAEARHRRIEEDEQDKLPVEEDFITSRSKLTEEAPISKQQHTSEESAPPLLPWQRSGDSGKMPKFQPVKFSAGPRPFSNRQGPEPYKPPSFKPVSVKDSAPDVKQDMLKRRSDFFSKPPEIGLLPVFGYSDDERDRDNRSGTSSPVIGASVTAEVQEPTEALIELQAQEPVESVAKPPPKQPLSLASRKAFNVEEERKRLERWHAEQERIRQEQYEQEQRRLREQQEKDLERAESEERRRKMEEQQKLIEKQQILQEQAAEEKRRLEEERKERVKKEQEYLERARLEREAAERERLKDEEEQRKMAAERKRREEERLRKEEEERQRKGAERRKAEEEEQRQREEEERHQRELEQLEQEAEERRIAINKLREKEAEERARRKKEEEARLAREQQEKEKERFARLREEEIERIRREEREKLRKEWEELQREKAKQEERERAERERLEQLRAEQERLRQERIKLEKQQEEERLQLLREKERLLEQSTSTKLDADKIPYNKQDRDRGSKSPDVIGKNNRSEEHEVPVKEEIIVSQEETDVHSAPPSKPHDSFKVPGQGYMSQFKDGRMATQHWMVEEAERRRLAEKTGTTRLHDPVEVHNDPILRKDLDMEPVLEKKNYAPEHVAPVRHMDKPANQEPVGKTRDHNRQPPPSSQNSQNQTYRELAVDVPPDFQPAPRRLRAPEIDAEKKKKIQNRQSMPDMGNRVPDVVRNDAYTPPPPQTSDRNSGRMPDNFLQQPQLGPPGRTSAFQQPSKKPAPGRSVSGKVTCSNCNKSLGRGAAMIIESLGLHFHIECFRCCVCNIQLGNGTQGTDVRIRASKLHCQNCYSNDAGFEFTEV
ncbi:LIM domain only protein 7-like isoform X4 [Acanthaster planci]|uniref:LIM domain only protein 7-like isoform X4 n=1 Tax=Acanthaster planci TaxID=133434 RepID=A0A8B7XFH7_ACAPL|nr:LIM domain only protein 7-like isoform X4 [Acanthaster planci]